MGETTVKTFKIDVSYHFKHILCLRLEEVKLFIGNKPETVKNLLISA